MVTKEIHIEMKRKIMEFEDTAQVETSNITVLEVYIFPIPLR